MKELAGKLSRGPETSERKRGKGKGKESVSENWTGIYRCPHFSVIIMYNVRFYGFNVE